MKQQITPSFYLSIISYYLISRIFRIYLSLPPESTLLQSLLCVVLLCKTLSSILAPHTLSLSLSLSLSISIYHLLFNKQQCKHSHCIEFADTWARTPRVSLGAQGCPKCARAFLLERLQRFQPETKAKPIRLCLGSICLCPYVARYCFLDAFGLSVTLPQCKAQERMIRISMFRLVPQNEVLCRSIHSQSFQQTAQLSVFCYIQYDSWVLECLLLLTLVVGCGRRSRRFHAEWVSLGCVEASKRSTVESSA